MTEVNPPIGTQSSEISEPVVDADVDALLEVIKQKDAIIDNCRSSLRESYDRWSKQQGRLEYLEKQADPELYAKYLEATKMNTDLKHQLLDEQRANERLNEKHTSLIATCLAVGFVAGLFLGFILIVAT